jgi:alpha-1,3-glucosyltransferase
MLIDNGHFQYNDISLGFFIAAVTFLSRGYDLSGSVFFVLALNYKQMELYHAVPFFAYLLGRCVFVKKSFVKLLAIAATVLTTFAIIWSPFLTDIESTKQVLSRIFPVARGVFEDKVANIWCSINSVGFKLKESFDQQALLKLCLGSTLLLLLPSNIHLFFRPSIKNFLLSLVNTSFVFFLCSFQVHEKSILLVAIPVALYCAQSDVSKHATLFGSWFLIVSTFSMFPLLVR